MKRHPLFRERALLEAPDRPLLVVEGEKGVEAVLSLGLDVLVTTNPMGAGKWRPEHTQALEGRSGGVVVVPDCDKAGRDHAAKVVQSLCEAGVQARLLDLWPERSDGFDIADFIEGNRAEASEWLRSQIGPTFEMLEHSVDGHFCRTRAFSDMRPEEPRPLIEDLIFLRCINILTGKPGSGKTNVAADLAAKVTLGKGARFAKSVSHPGYKVALDSPGSVLFISADEPVESAFQPRFLANGGDASRAFSLDEAIGADGKESLLNLTNLAPLESALRRHKPVLVIIDGMVAFTGRSKIYQPEEVYQLLRPLRVLAEKYDVAILLIRHQNKGQPEVIEDSGQGSVSFQGIARSEILIGKSPTTGQRAIFPIKQNYARGDLEPLDFRLEDAVIQDADGADVRTCHVVWEGASTLQLEDLFRKPAKASKKALAESFLRERLEGGEKVPVQTLMKEAPVGWRTVERAKDELEEDGFEISLGPIGFRGPWSWWHELSSARDGAPAPERHDPANGCGDLLAESERPESDSPLF
ncbi:MAG: AAA family ATPase [Planctomycetota bacterium]